MTLQTLYSLGTTRALVGILITTIATMLLLQSKKGKTGKVRGGGAIIIGPIPIVFGLGVGEPWLVLFAIAVAVLSVIMFLILHRKPSITRL